MPASVSTTCTLSIRCSSGSWREASRFTSVGLTEFVWKRWLRSNRAEVGDEGLDQEHAALGEMGGRVREAAHLGLLAGQAEEGVEGDEDERERALDRHVGEVAHRHRDAVAAGLLPELRDHRLGGVDAVHLEAPLGEREREPAGADRELEHRAVAGELGEQLDARLGLEKPASPYHSS